jgi:NAD(P)-dependent dehydrogenase (short-subunit alcohol dehydrogenase family)
MDIKGQTAYITGGASGLGEATARTLAAAGATVGLLDMNEDMANSVATELGGAAAHCNVTRIFVACAGIATGAKLVSRDGSATPLDKLTGAIQVNLIGTINSMRLAAADMAAMDPLDDGERGVIVTTTSIAAFEGQIGQGDYSASKGGVAASTITFARELAREGIRVNCISPGLMNTPMLAGLPDDVRESLVATTVFPKRLGNAAEYAALAKHIAENRYLNGSVIRLDGALRMAPR